MPNSSFGQLMPVGAKGGRRKEHWDLSTYRSTKRKTRGLEDISVKS